MSLIAIIRGILGINDIEAFWTLRDEMLRESSLHSINELACKVIRRRYGAGIPITKGINSFIAPHGFWGIFISRQAIIGTGCTIFQQVTIGYNNIKDSKTYGAPVIGQNCVIGAGAKIIGGVRIGNNVRIGANAVVVEDVPDNSTVVLNKPRIIVRKKSVLPNECEKDIW